MEEKKCLTCGGKLYSYNTNELQTRFTDGVQEYLCNLCADGANRALQKSREFYGIQKKAYNIVMKKYRRKNGIPIFGVLNAMQEELIENKRKSLVRLMLWMDIRAVKSYIKGFKKNKKCFKTKL